MKISFKVYTIILSTTIPSMNEPNDSLFPEFLRSWRNPVLHSVPEFVVHVEALPIFSRTCWTQSSPCTVTIARWMVAGLTPSAVRNLITPCCFSIVEFGNVNATPSSHALPRQLDGAAYKSLYSFLRMWAPPHAPIHGGDYNRRPRCHATLSHSGIGIYVNAYVVATFRTLSFEYPSYN